MIITAKNIQLNKGLEAIVDEADFDMLSGYKWHLNHYGYVVCSHYEKGGYTRKIFMHRLILDAPEGSSVDHINGNPLDNRRSNIRICEHWQNMQNKSLQSNNTSGYKGVCWHKLTKKWWARINVRGRQLSLGLYHSKDDAAQAYNLAAAKHFGEFASFNPIGEQA